MLKDRQTNEQLFSEKKSFLGVPDPNSVLLVFGNKSFSQI